MNSISPTATTPAIDYRARRTELLSGYRKVSEALPEQMGGFGELHRSAVAAGALSRPVKELMAMAVGIATHCEDCMLLHLHDALRAGATVEEVYDAIGVAVLMGGGPASTYATRAIEALEQFST